MQTLRADAVGDLLSRMTTEEKIGQLVLLTGYGATTGPVKEQNLLEDYIRRGECGNVFNVLGVDQIRRLQEIAIKETRLHVPLLFGFDTIHGYKTVFPIPLAEAASWNLELIEHSARVAATECSAAGLNWTFAPMVDIARDPRWGRICEGAGEDPFLGSLVAAARVRGFQGTNLASPDTVLACVKHYAAYGAPIAGRDYNTVDMSERTLRETYLPPYHAGVEAGALSVMTSFNELNGIPATANKFLLQEVLRKEWGFKGFVVTDYTSINEMVAHGIAADEASAGLLAFEAGVDMDMQGSVYRKYLKQQLARDEISENQINTAARRILEQKARLGLLADPFRYCNEKRQAEQLLSKDHRDAAYQTACQSFVLLKNQRGVLPLNPSSRIAVIGPLANSTRDLLGSWSGVGSADGIESILDSVRTASTAGKVTYAQGCDVASTNRSEFASALKAARASDVVIMVLGENSNMSGEAKSRTSINLPGVQTELLQAVAKLGKPVALVLLNGRPLALETEAGLADAILEVWFPGTEGARAVADTLFGKNSPSGKLPVTFPRNLGQVPIFYAAKNTGRPRDPAKPNEEYKSTYLDSPNTPLFPFGFGLSYASIEYSGLKLDRSQIKHGETVTVTITLTNRGTTSASDVAQLYIRDLVGSVTRPLLELKGFQKVTLQPGERRELRFRIGERDLHFLRADMTWGSEPGKFEIFVGPNSSELKSAHFELLPE